MTAILQHAERPIVPAASTSATVATPPRPGGIALVLGTGPEIIKLAPIIRELGDMARVVRTGRRFPQGISEVFFAEHGLTDPRSRLDLGADARAGRIALALERLDQLFAADRPDVVLVRGATDTALAGALAAHSNGIPLVHVEAGLRCHDLDLPEEHNRVLVDRVSDVLCASTQGNVGNLRAEGLDGRDIRLTGDTTVEAVHHRLMPERARLNLLRKWGLETDGYVLATLDRSENVDDEEALFAIMSHLAEVADAGYPVVLPAPPRTRAAAIRAGVLTARMGVRVVNPLWHSEFLALARHAALLVSDSGAVQEEATVLKRPILVVRRSTERPEVLREFGALVGPRDDIAGVALSWLADGEDRRAGLADLPCPFGDGHSSERIADAVRHLALVAAR
ncbi:UDP-N-acetylglucosamine 2-epimerase (non-hydrolysing) [Amycolatopsis arida]|uniref:UDP-N-acetylglucosamine 2-epimerase (Non-hydrolysing) n=1 Tax=Amycolatopsis arida TaxID=587909 RepID=A0A1I5SWD6_9PSEU|nr:UDP-N-acetylglucosamine 2-epimerase (non-hydrolyzing) [Amycolatopsis arida]TDX96322.1 UDP-N-acetylglucosamine 2-epimerase (non-hydrolysing) [Amycolatopsis arida]SFP75060.1 UDP-N-acetylglucosamine 2-epimerase (non-hydrolysing) [Amycolatopsis arida]